MYNVTIIIKVIDQFGYVEGDALLSAGPFNSYNEARDWHRLNHKEVEEKLRKKINQELVIKYDFTDIVLSANDLDNLDWL